MSLNIAFIGAGSINRLHMASARRLGLTLAAVADPTPATAADVCRQYEIARSYSDWRELLADPNIDAVVIGTPNACHAEQSIAALQAGKHVLLEKPMAPTLAECDRIVAAAECTERVFQMAMVNRFRSSTQALKDFIDAGKCGRIYSGQTFWYRRRGIPGFGGWFTTQAMSGGGALIDLGVHMVDLAMYLWDFPTPVAVSGMTYNVWDRLDDYTYTEMWARPTPDGRKDVEDYALGIVRFEGGLTLQINIAWALNANFEPEQGLRLMGDRGGVALHGIDKPHFFGEEAGHLIDTQPHCTAGDPMLDEMHHFVQCIQQSQAPMATVQQGRMVLSILDGLYRSAREGQEIRLAPPSTSVSIPAIVNGNGQRRNGKLGRQVVGTT